MNHQVPEYLLALTLTRALNKDTLYDGPARLSPFIGSLVPRVNSSSKGTRVIRPPALAHSEDECAGAILRRMDDGPRSGLRDFVSAAFKRTMLAMVIVDDDLCFVDANPAACEL
jgi:hypothetical protein